MGGLRAGWGWRWRGGGVVVVDCFLIQECYRRRISIPDHGLLWAQCVHH